MSKALGCNDESAKTSPEALLQQFECSVAKESELRVQNKQLHLQRKSKLKERDELLESLLKKCNEEKNVLKALHSKKVRFLEEKQLIDRVVQKFNIVGEQKENATQSLEKIRLRMERLNANRQRRKKCMESLQCRIKSIKIGDSNENTSKASYSLAIAQSKLLQDKMTALQLDLHDVVNPGLESVKRELETCEQRHIEIIVEHEETEQQLQEKQTEKELTVHQIDADEASLKATQEASTLSNQQRDEILTEQTERVNTEEAISQMQQVLEKLENEAEQISSSLKSEKTRCQELGKTYAKAGKRKEELELEYARVQREVQNLHMERNEVHDEDPGGEDRRKAELLAQKCANMEKDLQKEKKMATMIEALGDRRKAELNQLWNERKPQLDSNIKKARKSLSSRLLSPLEKLNSRLGAARHSKKAAEESIKGFRLQLEQALPLSPSNIDDIRDRIQNLRQTNIKAAISVQDMREQQEKADVEINALQNRLNMKTSDAKRLKLKMKRLQTKKQKLDNNLALRVRNTKAAHERAIQAVRARLPSIALSDAEKQRLNQMWETHVQQCRDSKRELEEEIRKLREHQLKPNPLSDERAFLEGMMGSQVL